LTQNAFTKVTFDVELFDTNNNFASSRFSPTAAGYYQLNYSVNYLGNATPNYGVISCYKNGAEYSRSTAVTGTSVYNLAGSTLVYLNGTTDYVEVFVYVNQASISSYGANSSSQTFFSGTMIRGA
jgi:hypothetical protein